MNKKSFSIGAAVSYGWNTMKKNFKFFFFLLLIMLAANTIPGSIASALENNHAAFLGFMVRIVGWVIQLVVALGVIGIALRIYDRKKVAYKNLLDYTSLVIPYFLASIIYGAIVVVGLILLVVPGIVWAIKFRYFSYFMVDRKLGPIDALKASAKITKGKKWQLFFLGLMLLAINIVGLLALIVGLFATIPLTMMAEAYVFRKLSAK